MILLQPILFDFRPAPSPAEIAEIERLMDEAVAQSDGGDEQKVFQWESEQC